MLSILTAAAWAGSGPWVVAQGDQNVYLGSEAQRLTQLAVSTGSFSDDVLDIGAGGPITDPGAGISTFGMKAIVTYGLLPRAELELGVPYYRVRFNRQDDAICTELLGEQACAANKGLGVITGRAKVLLLDELYGPVVSLAAGAELRHGDFTAPERGQLTNLGEGTTDIGAFASVGRTGAFGAQGAWSTYAELGGRYRMPNASISTEANADLGVVPNNELWGSWESLVGTITWGAGPMISYFHRPQGLDFEELLTDPELAGDDERLAALNALSVQAGAKIVVRSEERVSFSAGVARTLYAENNPADLVSVNAGISVRNLWRRTD